MSEHICRICKRSAVFVCPGCTRLMCMRHRRRRKVDDEWGWWCESCAEKISEARKKGKRA